MEMEEVNSTEYLIINRPNVPYTVCECLVAILAVIGNLMVIIVFKQERRLRRRTNYYIVSLAIADLLVGLLGVPFAILASIGWPTNLYACLFSLSLLIVLCTISIFCLVAVSVDRYWAILHPMAYSRNVRTKTAIVIIAMCWLFGGLVGFLPIFGIHQKWNNVCFFVHVMDYNYLVFLYVATIITPSVILIAFYAHIYRVVLKQLRQFSTLDPINNSKLKHRRSTQSMIGTISPQNQTPQHGKTMLRVLGASRKREVKATQNLSIIVFFFMVCWIPLYTINCIKAFSPDLDIPGEITDFCIILSHLNSAVNPLLYAYHLKDFRRALKILIMKMFRMKIDPTPDNNFGLSVASKHQDRISSMLGQQKSTSTKPRIYIDSPVWLRSQSQQPDSMSTRKSNELSAISTSFNSIHNTMTAVASISGNDNREIWNIVEVPSTAEDSQNNMDHLNYDSPSCSNVSRSSIGDCDRKHRRDDDENDDIDDDDDEDDKVFMSNSSLDRTNDVDDQTKSLFYSLDFPYCEIIFNDDQNHDDDNSLPLLSKKQQNDRMVHIVSSSNSKLDKLNNENYDGSPMKNHHTYQNSNSGLKIRKNSFKEPKNLTYRHSCKIPNDSIFTVEKRNGFQPLELNGSNSCTILTTTDCNRDDGNCCFVDENKSPNRILKSNNSFRYKFIDKIDSSRLDSCGSKTVGNDSDCIKKLNKNSFSTENISRSSPFKVVSKLLFPQNSCSSITDMLDRINTNPNSPPLKGQNHLKRTFSDS